MKPRNLVILSDGTGNSAAKITKTNIWRIYEALDLEKGDQLAFYDDGVGTGGFRLLRAVGGAFGFGLARNVRELYVELCRHYESGDDGAGDNIFLFGFSRGAFTARVLSGLIRHCGIIDRRTDETIRVWRWTKFSSEEIPVATEEGLRAAAKVAYRAMRKRNDKAWVSYLYRAVRDGVFGIATPKTEKFRARYAVSKDQHIKFLGVFDTVSAYGLPVDEMAIAIHNHIVPLRFPDNILSKRVDHAYQALALDEARHTFHPVLWTEREFRPDWKTAPPDKRPNQVWFAGMHADVGGGYADDRLSLVPGLWLIEQARDVAGLRFRPAAIEALRTRANPLGEMHDSRRGAAAFYRYKPRILEEYREEDLDGNGRPEVQTDDFLIHHSVFDRIKATGADYAPAGIPEEYRVVMPSTSQSKKDKRLNVVSADDADYESAERRQTRMILQNAVGDTIVRRRAVFYLLLGLALVFIALPLLWLPNPAYIPEGWEANTVSALLWPLGFLPLPEPERITQFWSEHPRWFGAVAFGLVAAWRLSSALKRSMQARLQRAWGHMAGKPAHETVARRQWVESWRKFWGGTHRVWTKKAMPLLLVLLLFIGAPALVVWRYAMFHDYGLASVCSAEQQKPEGAGNITFTTRSDSENTIAFSTKATCLDTGIQMKKGRIYRLTIRVQEEWKDKMLPADPTGLRWRELSLKQKAFMSAAAVTRRFWSEDWFALMGSIGRAREFAFRIDVEPVADEPDAFTWRFKAWRSGTLYLFVNDAIVPGKDFYANNSGTAETTIVEDGEI